MKVLAVMGGILLVAALALGGSYNKLVGLEEGVNKAWSQVENVYQRRLDLIPNLVETVKGYASHESQTLTQVAEARARAAGSLSAANPTDPAKFAQFQESQAVLSSALSRLLVVVERYPDLKANQSFLALQASLEGTENRISVERQRFNEAAQAFNTAVRRFPANLTAGILGFRAKEYFKADATASTAPKVQF